MSEGGRPPSFLPDNVPAITRRAAAVELPPLNVQRLREEDSKTPGQNRFSAPILVDIAPENAGQWFVLPDGRRLWQCAIRSEGAKGLVLSFDRFQLPAGSRLYAYTADKQHVLGAYTEKSCLPSGEFLIGVLKGEMVWLEYESPSSPTETAANIHINRVDYVYEKDGLAEFDFGDGLSCNFNVNCTLGNAWQSEKKGVARILMTFSNGMGWCTGSLIANTSGSTEPYFLTAHHCQLIGLNPNFNLWRFDFDYEGPNCPNPTAEPTPKSVLGCQRLSFRQETDFMLLKLNPIPGTYGLYFNGWNRGEGTTQPHGTFIHHPSGDIKKISVDSQQVAVYPAQVSWGGIFGISLANTHWKVDPDYGIYQPGSSGCPLFDPNKRIVGQLHGGVTAQGDPCNIIAAYFGRFNQSFNGNTPDVRLSDWLDATNTGKITQNGYAQPITTRFNLSGNVKTHWGTPMANVRIRLVGGALRDSTLTDSLGNYQFKNVLAGGTYLLTPVSDELPLNGVTTLDLALITKHVLGLEYFNSPWKIVAADANRSNTVTTFDVVEARKLILGIYDKLPFNPAWRFFLANTAFSDPTNPFASGTTLEEDVEIVNLQNHLTNLDFVGVKIGDTNNTAK